ncbi:MAG: SpoIIE family protein phosphatase [Anaerolineales bacterium]|nr:SpoIIE family protein phosphatase [Anaerolineales bacterium]
MAATYANVLIIDDNGERCVSITTPLYQWGWYRLIVAHSPTEAVAYLASETVDLVIVQVSLALQDEFLILTQLRKTASLRHTPVIITATFADLPLVTKCIPFGEIDFLPLPIVDELLQHRVIANMEKQQLLKQSLSSLTAYNATKRVTDDLKQIILPLGIKLSMEKNFDHLLSLIVSEAKSLCHADMGILYLRVKDDQLQPVVMMNNSLTMTWIGADNQQAPFSALFLYDEHGLPNQNLTTRVALTEQTSNIPNTYDLTNAINLAPIPEFDAAFGYKSISCLTVPLNSQEMMGVLQLINAYDPISQKVVPFTQYHQQVLESLASQAAVALQNLVLRHRHEELLHYEQELQIGHDLQMEFLPKTLPHPAGWEIGARFYPAAEVSGDFYDVFSMRRDKLGLVIADICDKGMAAALFMALIRTLVRAYGQRNDYYDRKRFGIGLAPVAKPPMISQRPFHQEDVKTLTDAIGLTNYYISQNHYQSHLFATLFYGVLDPPSGKLMYINCGHNPPILFHTHTGEIELLQPTGPALGLSLDARFAVSEVDISPGMIFLAYTDGVTEIRNPQNEMFTKQRLQKILSATPFTVDELLSRIETAIREHKDKADQIDDITLLAIHHLPPT